MRLTAMVLIATATMVAGVQMARPALTPARTAPPSNPAPLLREKAREGPERSAVGTLERVEGATMQFVVTTSDGKLAFHLQNGATIRQGSRTLKPAELGSHTGERVKVRYRESGGERRATWLVLAARPADKGRSHA